MKASTALGIAASLARGAGGGVAALALSLLPGPGRGAASVEPPLHLADTGLYADIARHTLDPRNLHYSPQYPLWSDGARKNRWIFLPAGKTIDASNPDSWDFPVGTKVWKEFSFGRRVETRYLVKTSRDGWIVATYVWNDDETDAVRAPDEGIRNQAEIAPGKRHDIPSVADCRTCHEGGQVLGFGALQLSRDRDPGVPHAEPFTPDMVDLSTLIERGLLASYPREWADHPPRIAAASPTERSALGYLHANCGSCHDRSTSLASIGMMLRQATAPGAPPDPVGRTVVLQRSGFQLPGDGSGPAYRIEPGSPARSTVVLRMSTRNPMRQMPPLGTKVVDEKGVELIRKWIGWKTRDAQTTLDEREKP